MIWVLLLSGATSNSRRSGNFYQITLSILGSQRHAAYRNLHSLSLSCDHCLSSQANNIIIAALPSISTITTTPCRFPTTFPGPLLPSCNSIVPKALPRPTIPNPPNIHPYMCIDDFVYYTRIELCSFYLGSLLRRWLWVRNTCNNPF